MLYHVVSLVLSTFARIHGKIEVKFGKNSILVKIEPRSDWYSTDVWMIVVSQFWSKNRETCIWKVLLDSFKLESIKLERFCLTHIAKSWKIFPKTGWSLRGFLGKFFQASFKISDFTRKSSISISILNHVFWKHFPRILLCHDPKSLKWHLEIFSRKPPDSPPGFFDAINFELKY